MVRTLAALVLVAAIATAAAAEPETITLADGRTFTGVYDEDAQVLHTATQAGKSFDLTIKPEQIASREAAKKAAAAAPAKRAEPAPMSAEDKAAAGRDFAYQQKIREADALDADAVKLRRDAAEARKMAQKQMDHARNDWRAFCDRAALEGIGLSPDGPISETLIVLPRTKGNNRGSMEGVALSKQTAAKAPELEQAAQQKTQAAAAARAAAEQMPHGPAAAWGTASLPPAAPVAVAPVATPAAAPADLAAAIASLDQADIEEDKRHAAARADLVARRQKALSDWMRTADLHDASLPVLGQDPHESEAKDYHARLEMNRLLAELRAVKQSNPNGVPDARAIELAKGYWSLFLATR